MGALAGIVPGPVIAALYDDLYIDTSLGATVSDKTVAGQYYAVTYQVINGYTDITAAASSNFQVAMFFGATTIGSFTFQAGDIAISYGALNSTIQTSTYSVGVAASAANATSAPGSTDGQFTSFASMPTGSSFFLFRPSGSTYTASIRTTAPAAAVPEPASLVMLGLGVAGLVGVGRRRLGRAA